MAKRKKDWGSEIGWQSEDFHIELRYLNHCNQAAGWDSVTLIIFINWCMCDYISILCEISFWPLFLCIWDKVGYFSVFHVLWYKKSELTEITVLSVNNSVEARLNPSRWSKFQPTVQNPANRWIIPYRIAIFVYKGEDLMP